MKLFIYNILFINVCWIYFLAIMHLRDARDAGRLSGFVKYLSYANLAIGLVLDVILNLIPVSVILLEWPRIFDKEWLTTSRLKRHIQDSDGWRKAVSLWCCKNMLSTFDSTQRHCGE